MIKHDYKRINTEDEGAQARLRELEAVGWLVLRKSEDTTELTKPTEGEK